MQTKKQALIEALTSTGSGFILAVLVQQFVINPLYGLNQPFVANVSIVIIFTIFSFGRVYFLRRFFNWLFHRGKK